MQTFMSEAIVLDAVLISVLLALWITWFALRGLFGLMSVMHRPQPSGMVQPIRVTPTRGQVNRRRDAA